MEWIWRSRTRKSDRLLSNWILLIVRQRFRYTIADSFRSGTKDILTSFVFLLRKSGFQIGLTLLCISRAKMNQCFFSRDIGGNNDFCWQLTRGHINYALSNSLSVDWVMKGVLQFKRGNKLSSQTLTIFDVCVIGEMTISSEKYIFGEKSTE